MNKSNIAVIALVSAAVTLGVAGSLEEKPGSGAVKPTEERREKNKWVMNQVGFKPTASKYIDNLDLTYANQPYKIVNTQTGEKVLQGQVSEPTLANHSNVSTVGVDASAIAAPGEYAVTLEDGEQQVFVVSENAYKDSLTTAMKAFYYNRAGVALHETYAEDHQRPAAHPDLLVHVYKPDGAVSTEFMSSPKGWYDAGDYNKYTINSAISLYTLFSVLDDFEATQKLALNIPESTNSRPDFLDEIMWNFDWFITMQDTQDGGVYHKVTTKRFSNAVMPHETYAPRYILGKNAAASLDYAATMVQAARVLLKHNWITPETANDYLARAEAAYAWAQKNKDQDYKQPSDIHTGAYRFPKDDFSDEWLWASAELYIATGKDKYKDAIVYPSKAQEAEWSHVGMLGLFSLAQERQDKKAITLIAEFADSLVDNTALEKIVPMSEKDFRWGSNAVVMNKAMALLKAYQLTGNQAYYQQAQARLDYALGRNPMAVSYVTGVGFHPVMNIHHRQSYSDTVVAPVPGWIAGGPHSGGQDMNECKKDNAAYETEYPATSYVDHWCSYATNEVAINWNAPLVYVLAGLNYLAAP